MACLDFGIDFEWRKIMLSNTDRKEIIETLVIEVRKEIESYKQVLFKQITIEVVDEVKKSTDVLLENRANEMVDKCAAKVLDKIQNDTKSKIEQFNKINENVSNDKITMPSRKSLTGNESLHGKNFADIPSKERKDTVWVFYPNEEDNNRLYKRKLDGSQNICLTADSIFCVYDLDEFWVYYKTNDRKLRRIKRNGSKAEENHFGFWGDIEYKGP